EFIHPQGFITQLKHKNAPIFSASAEDWKIELINNATFSVVGDGLLNIIYCQDADALTKLSDEFLKIKELHPSARFSIRKDLTFYFRFKNHNSKNIKEHMLNIWKVSGLISILTDKPTLPDELYIKFEGGHTRTPCLLTTRFEQRTIDLALKKFDHRSLPINWKSIDIEKAFEKWFEISDRYIPLTITYQYETGYRTLHQAHSDIILFATQIEAINSTLGGEKREKYIKPIDEYASTFLRKKMNNFFIRFNNNSLGANIATLRNELAHVDRDKELMTQMTLDEYIRIGLYLRLIITSHLLSNLGIEKEHIQRYQNRVAQD
ncbi:hypothetical protein M8051_004950, partial [Salmonella enterica]|nr:hypothetical protein [Salmonella enterica]